MDMKQQPTQGNSGPSNTAFWTFDFYQQFFNVDTNDVLLRIVKTIVPWKPDFISSIKVNPDLWGPFWISTALLIVLSISSNLGDFFNWYRAFKELAQQLPPPNGSGSSPWVPEKTLVQWTNDFSTITIAAFVIYSYVFLLPIVLWVFMKWKNIAVSLIQVISLYGYGIFMVHHLFVYKSDLGTEGFFTRRGEIVALWNLWIHDCHACNILFLFEDLLLYFLGIVSRI
jgi:hypothetical protein